MLYVILPFIGYLCARFIVHQLREYLLYCFERSQFRKSAQCWMHVEVCGTGYNVRLTIACPDDSSIDILRYVPSHHLTFRQQWYYDMLVEHGIIFIIRRINVVHTPLGYLTLQRWWLPQPDEVESMTAESRKWVSDPHTAVA